MLKNREYIVDNGKYVLINLVVIGHIIEPILTNDILKSLYIFIYLFHMPCFVMISGYLAAKSQSNRINHIIVTYIVFQVIYSLFSIYILKESDSIQLAKPYWIMWFLMSLFLWKLITPYFIKLKYPNIIAVIMSVLVGYDSSFGYLVSLSRTAVLFPFYLIGFYSKKNHLEIIYKVNTKLVSSVALLVGYIIVLKISPYVDVKWTYHALRYNKLSSLWYAGGYRLLLLITGFILSLSFLSLIPKKRTFFSDRGKRSLQVYLLHGFVIKGMIYNNIYQYIDSVEKIVFLILGGIVATYLLSCSQIEKTIQKIIAINMYLLCRAEYKN